ncbi:MAG TPA: RdgB/HAM1 family non-canonical purine NTP pyrophosphatase [Cytophagales bacterium]|nr:RdgB/HAM1 family non-canonical purine NTP pyrophosphatase [Cytophagales bacterium]
MKLCFATNNAHKIHEVKALLGNEFEILSLEKIGFKDDLAEDHETLEGNSLQKAEFIYNKFRISCFADDSGLEVPSLNYQPGARSARYAGNQRNDQANNSLLLDNLSNSLDRRARFRTVISLIINDEKHQFEGIVEGEIIKEQRGHSGFGYDPLFVPSGYTQTFAEMTLPEKNSMSHRAKAVEKLIRFLQKYNSR